LRFSWVQYTTLNIPCDILQGLFVVLGHRKNPLHEEGIASEVLVFKLLFLVLFEKLSDVLRYDFPFCCCVAHRCLFIVRNVLSRILQSHQKTTRVEACVFLSDRMLSPYLLKKYRWDKYDFAPALQTIPFFSGACRT